LQLTQSSAVAALPSLRKSLLPPCYCHTQLVYIMCACEIIAVLGNPHDIPPNSSTRKEVVRYAVLQFRSQLSVTVRRSLMPMTKWSRYGMAARDQLHSSRSGTLAEGMLELASGPSWKARSRSFFGTIPPTNTPVDRAGIMQRIIAPTNKNASLQV